ncbi:MAG: hypothetical protein HC767_02140 [Akkermansiaceae bacterium]|nr:hypothetical protein [Akkermansiaceae bacterium]
MKNDIIPSFTRRVIAATEPVVLENFYLPEVSALSQKQDITDRKVESGRILKRLLVITGDHSESARRLGIKFQPDDVRAVIEALRSHAKGSNAVSVPGERGEVHQHVLDSLFSELVEEPSNILFTTVSGPDSIRYDAMEPTFWIECLDLLEKTLCEKISP